jgi:enoyl-[acyl-carrier-protein] reductase (NADH)
LVEDVLKKSEDRFVDWETLAQFQQQMRKSLQEINEKAEKALAQSDVSAGQIVDLRTQLKAEFKDIKELICSIAAGNNNAMSDGNMSTCASPMSEQAAVKA